MTIVEFALSLQAYNKFMLVWKQMIHVLTVSIDVSVAVTMCGIVFVETLGKFVWHYARLVPCIQPVEPNAGLTFSVSGILGFALFRKTVQQLQHTQRTTLQGSTVHGYCGV